MDLASGVLKNSCIYIFHIIYLEKSIWKLILLQVKIFSIFSGSVEQSSFLKILSANCVRETILYLLQNYLCINRHFVNLANKSETICLSRDCRGINANEPGRFRIQANNAEEWTCYFIIKNSDTTSDTLNSDTFLSKWIRNSNLKEADIHFQIERIQGKSKNSETFDATVELESLIKNGIWFIGKDRNQEGTNSGRN